MTKNNKIELFLMLGVICLCILTVVGCSTKEKDYETKVLEIKQDYADEFLVDIPDKNVNDVIVNYYIGKYNNYFILMLSYKGEPFFDMVNTIYFDNLELTYPNSNKLRAWKDGAFYELEELYELKELSTSDIERIIKEYNSLYQKGK